MTAAIETHDLVKRYGTITALDGVSLRVEEGTIFGLLGQNGAGKTTLIKILLGITNLTRGDAQLLGQPAGTARVRERVGYLPEDHRFPEYHTGASLLDFYGGLLGLPRGERRRRAEPMLDMVGLKDRRHSKIRTYSKGMKQRLGIAQALFHDPQMVFLDEPTDGVDPVGRREIRDVMLRLKSRGVTLFLNSHLLSEVEQVCDRIAILHKGKVVREGTIADLTKQRDTWVIGLAPDEALPAAEVERLGGRCQAAGAQWRIDLEPGQSIDPVLEAIRSRGLHLRHLVQVRESLEELFLQAVKTETIPAASR